MKHLTEKLEINQLNFQHDECMGEYANRRHFLFIDFVDMGIHTNYPNRINSQICVSPTTRHVKSQPQSCVHRQFDPNRKISCTDPIFNPKIKEKNIFFHRKMLFSILGSFEEKNLYKDSYIDPTFTIFI
jgi:hypothetical protein